MEGKLSTVSKRTRKAFVAYVDTHIGAHIADRFLSLKYEVSGMCRSSTPTAAPVYPSTAGSGAPVGGSPKDMLNNASSASVLKDADSKSAAAGTASSASPGSSNLASRLAGLYPRTSDPEAIRRALLEADVVVYYTPGCAEDSVRALRVLESSVFDTQNEKRFILVSSTQSWFETTSMQQQQQQQQQVFAADALDEDIAAAMEGVSEDQYNRRIPHVRHQAWRDVEKMCAATHSEGRIRTFVVFAGLVYGNGEDLLLPYMRQAWSLAPAGLPVYGSGNQIVPMIHVHDLTTFCVNELGVGEAAAQPDSSIPRYVFATDEGQQTWKSIIKAVNAALGNGRTFTVPPAEYGLYENVEQFTINLKVEPGQIQELMPDEERWASKAGFVANIARVAQEFRQARNLMPHRVLLLGPPSAGKSFVGKSLGELFQIPHLTIADIIAEYRYQKVELLEAIAARKEERLQSKRAERLEEKRRAFVEERKSAAESGEAAAQPHDPDDDEYDEDADDEALAITLTDEEQKEIAELVAEENQADETISTMQDKIAEVERVCAMKWKPLADEGQEPVNPRDKLKQGTRQSTNIMSTAAQKATAAKAATVKKTAAAGGAKGGAASAAAAANQAAEEEANAAEEARKRERLSDRALGFMVRWKLGSSASCRNQGYILDGWPKTVRQARLVFEDSDEHVVPDDPENEPDMPLDKEVRPCNNVIFPEFVFQLTAGDDFLLHRLLRTQQQAAHNTPEGFQRRLDAYKANFDVSNSVMHFFESARTTSGRITHIKHVPVDAEPLVPEDVPAKQRASEFDAKTHPPVAMRIAEWIGQPRNLGPSPADALREAQRARNLAEEERGLEEARLRQKATKEAEELAAVKESRRQLDEKAKRLQSVERQMLEERKAPLKAYLMQNVIPVLTKGLMEVCIRQPDDPVEFLAEWLFRHNPEDHPEMYS